MSNDKLLSRFFLIGIIALCLLVTGLALSPQLTYGQFSGWASPERISTRGQTSWFPDVAVDPAGTTHIVWSSGFLDYDLVYHTAFLNDGTKQDPIEIRAQYQTGGEATRPTLFADKTGILHLTFRDTQVYYSQVNASQAHSSKHWSPDYPISEGYFSEVAVDSKGKIHFIFTRNVISGACQVCYHVFYVSSEDNGTTWSDEIDISGGTSGSAKPQIIIDKKDNVHVVWESGIGGGYGQLSDTDPTDVMYVSSYDNGKTWGTPLQLNPSDMIAKSIAIQMDGRSHLIVVWWDINDDSIYYQTSANLGVNWSLPYRIPNVLGTWAEYHSKLDDYAMDVDSTGNVHLVFVGRYDLTPIPIDETEEAKAKQTPTPSATPIPVDGRARLNVFHMVWDGLDWGDEEAIESYVGDVPEWPRIAVGLGNKLNVVWFVRAEKDIWKGGGEYAVWYSTKTIASTKYTPAAYPTIVSQPTTSPTLPVVETATITPVMELPENVQVKTGELVYKEMDYMQVAGLSILPVVLLVVVLFFINRKFRL